MKWLVASVFAAIFAVLSPVAQASPACAALSSGAEQADKVVKSETVRLTSPGANASDAQKEQLLVQITDAALRGHAALAACAATDADDAPRAARIRAWQPDRSQAVSGALAQGSHNCEAVLVTVQGVLNEMGKTLNAGRLDMVMPFLIDAALAMNKIAAPVCSARQGPAIAAFAKQGEEQRKMFDVMNRCQIARNQYASMMGGLLNVIKTKARADYDAFMKASYDPAYRAVRSDCASFASAIQDVSSSDALARKYEALQAEVAKRR